MLRGKDTFAVSSQQLRRATRTPTTSTPSPRSQIGQIETIIRRIRDVGPEGPHAAALQRRGGGRVFLDAGAAHRDPRRDGCHARQPTRDASSPPSTTTRSSPPGRCWADPSAGWSAPRSPSPRHAQPQPKRLIDFIRWAVGPADHAPLLHLRDARLLHLQGRRGAHELGHGQQAGAHPHDPRICRTGSRSTRCSPSSTSSFPGRDAGQVGRYKHVAGDRDVTEPDRKPHRSSSATTPSPRSGPSWRRSGSGPRGRKRHRPPHALPPARRLSRCASPARCPRSTRSLPVPEPRAAWRSGPRPIFKYALLVVHRALAASGIVITPGARAPGGHHLQLGRRRPRRRPRGRPAHDRRGQAAAALTPTPTPASTWSAARSPC